MMKLEILPDERQVLLDVVDRSLSATRVEHRRTRNPEWQDRLRDEEEALLRLRNRLDALPDED